MWTGDIQSGYPTQWALNPSAYQNLPNEQVDWATLAQQWIKMKETFPVDQVPPAPPPPSIKADIEAGEAPMDMSKDEINPIPPTSSSQDGNWDAGGWNSWQQWNWGWSGSSGQGPDMAHDKTGLPPHTYSAPTPTPAYSTETPTATFDYNHGASIPENFDQQGYWSGGGPAPFLRNKPDWRADSRGSSNRRQSSKVEEIEPDTTALLDATKRKQLPAWIREGLEKMEREKQKKLEHERQLKEREEEMLRRKQEEEEALASGIPIKSKFDTDSEESEKEAEEVLVKPRRSRFDASTPSLPKPTITNSFSPPLPIKRKSREEIMQDVMQQVRYILTDILMTVTNEEMQNIAEEVLADFRAKAPATQLRKTPALTSLTGKLGLGMYDSDSEDSSAESDNEPSPPTKRENGLDSDEELRERINRKRQEFARVERDIEHQVEQQEERERERELMAQQVEDPPDEKVEIKAQVEPKLSHPGIRPDLKTEESKPVMEAKLHDQNSRPTEFFTPERSLKTEKESSDDHTEESDRNSSSRSASSSSSSSGFRHKKSRKSKKRKEKKSSKRKHKRSSSRGSDMRKSSHRKSSRRYDERERHRYERSRSRSRSHSRDHYEDYRRKRSPSYRRHSSESSHKRRHHSYSHSPEYSRGKKSSHRSRD